MIYVVSFISLSLFCYVLYRVCADFVEVTLSLFFNRPKNN